MGPLQRLKYLPWKELSLGAGLTLLCVLAIEGVLLLAILYLQPLRALLDQVFSNGAVTLLIQFGLNLGVGALAVYLVETVWPRLVLNAGSLWALFLCVLLALLLQRVLPLPALVQRLDQLLLGGFNQFSLVGVMLGAFWKGRSYWQRY